MALSNTFPDDSQAPAAGSAITVMRSGHAVIWLLGEIDISVQGELATIAFAAAGLGTPLVIDPTHMTFCDNTLTAFLVSLTTQGAAVVVRNPTRLMLEWLTVAGVTDLVKLEDVL